MHDGGTLSKESVILAHDSWATVHHRRGWSGWVCVVQACYVAPIRKQRAGARNGPGHHPQDHPPRSDPPSKPRPTS